jgi:hypothetical protein
MALLIAGVPNGKFEMEVRLKGCFGGSEGLTSFLPSRAAVGVEHDADTEF